MKVIYKYPLDLDPVFSRRRVLALPRTAQILHVGEQKNLALELWALVDRQPKLRERHALAF